MIRGGKMEEQPYKVYLKEIHWQEVVVDAVSGADAIEKAKEGEGAYGNGTTYSSTCDDGHRVEEF